MKETSPKVVNVCSDGLLSRLYTSSHPTQRKRQEARGEMEAHMCGCGGLGLNISGERVKEENADH